ncbi:ABC transporter permease [Limnothrix sp. FACHB-881]|uniref:ABC transporter permease n=1 Tax=unclassified Limnothrix TaxID=2632864 RepID=UPI00081DA16C|nr:MULTISPECIES: ABC transporter permease [unclassified Limnothrix]OCQ91524.1 peptide ABC transporter permease [Limnothrix sp. P13C2]MBD2160703.1 ABC transporter permease [Limnothrix sp. FACHB-1083]MBD2191454.1 ABC transporter permease [Limnothrix sp. FACHB-1088]MBD2554014.1 ABC transporter permease [Limnothrix sp. FACHB-708]MBD2592513.1 ABC transporter permease [Limnothrix sp. FACHB-406]
MNHSESLWGAAWRRFCRDRLALFGLICLGAIGLAALVGPWLYPLSPTDLDYGRAYQGPSLAHWLGTNDRGQDLLARVLSGGRVSLTVGIASMLVAVTLGTTIGAVAGFYGGWVDGLLMRLTDLFLALPQLPLLLLLIYLFREPLRAIAGPELGIFLLVIGAIGGLNWMSVARLIRANFLTLRERNFVLAAYALGARSGWLIWRHILPNAIGPAIVAASLAVGTAILTESTLNFLGLGFPPDVPTWGRMLYDAQNFLETAPHMAIFPGLAIFMTVLSANFIGDGLRDAIDPQQRSS